MKSCKRCNETTLNIFPNGLCQRCLSIDLEQNLRLKGKEIELDAETLVDDYLVYRKSMRQIAKENLIKPHKVKSYLTKYSIPVRDQTHANTKYVDKDVFKELTISSAFLLGYIFTDGDLLLNETTGKYFLRIYSKYKYKIENAKKILRAEAKIQHRKAQTHKGRNQSEMFFIHIANEYIIDDLLDYGMVLNKNQAIRFPEIPEHLIPHFLRGVWSGSGSVMTYKDRPLTTLVNGSYKFITEVERRLNAVGLKKRKIYINKHSKKSSFTIKYAMADTEKLYRYLYAGVTDETTCVKQEKIFKEYFGENQLRFF
jgi:hypothetical protein